MKKIRFLSAVIVVMLSISMSQAFGARPASSVSTSFLPIQQDGSIKYVVNVKTTPQFTFPTCKILVVVTDEHNRLVAPAQLFTSNTTFYYFAERGPVTGTRIAHLRLASENAGSTAPVCSFYALPDEESGTFYNNVIYKFTLLPISNNPK
jgi:hypothetical protein